MNSKNIATTKTLGVNVKERKDMVKVGENDTRLIPTIQYELVASEDFAFNSIVSFKAGEKKKVTGMLAEKLIMYSGGIVTLVDEEREAQLSREAAIEARLKKLEAAEQALEEKKEAAKEVEPVVEVETKTTKKKSTDKVEE